MKRLVAAAGVLLLLALPTAAHGGRCDRIEPVPPDESEYVPDEAARRPVPPPAHAPPSVPPAAGDREAPPPQTAQPVTPPTPASEATHAERHAAERGPLVLATQEPVLDVRRVLPVRAKGCLRRSTAHCAILALRAELTTEPGLHVVADLDKRALLWSGRHEPYATTWSRRPARSRSLRFAHGFAGPLLGPGEYRLTVYALEPSGLVRASRLLAFRLE